MRKSTLSITSLLMILILSLTACGQTKTTPTSGSVSSGKSQFVTSDYFDPPPAINANAWAPSGINGGMGEYCYDRLFEYAPLPTKTFIPQLAASFVEKDNKTIITLNKDIVWSDGKPFTSKDVMSTYNLGFLAGWPMWKYLDKIETPDDLTVSITWKKSGAILSIMAFSNLINGPYSIYGKWSDQIAKLTDKRDADGNPTAECQTALTKIREDLYKFKPVPKTLVGTGPYTVSNVTASEAVLVKNPKFRTADKVTIDSVKVQRYVSVEAYLSTVMSNGYDGEPHGAAPDVFKQIQTKNPKMKIFWIPEYSEPAMQFNTMKAPFDKPEVRKAICYAIDRKALLPILEPGTVLPDMTNSGMVPSIKDKFVDKEIQSKLVDYSYNPDKATELLNSIGWKKQADGWYDDKGKLVQLEVASMNSWAIFFMGGDSVTSQLNDFGLKTTFKAMELSAYWQYIDSGNAQMSFDFRAGCGGYVYPWEGYRNLYIDGGNRLGFVTNPKDPKPKDVIGKLPSGETVNATTLIDQLFYTSDLAKQKELTGKLAELTNEVCPFMPIGEKTAPWKIYNTKLTGFPSDPLAPEWYGGAGMRPVAKLIKLGMFSLSK